MKSIVLLFLAFLSFETSAQDGTVVNVDSLVELAKSQVGVTYKWGTSNPNVSFDCSGFTSFIYSSFDVKSSRSSKAYGALGEKVPLEECQVGDCIVFSGTKAGSKTIGHVGIVIEKNEEELKFIHCSSSKKHYGVTVTDYYSSNYTKRFLEVRRMFSSGSNLESENPSDISPVIATIDTLKYTQGICSILQDRKGNYWFGSYQEGACLFDGEKFTYFTVNDGLSDNQVRTIQEDQNGGIWFGTAKGVTSYKNGIIETYFAENSSTLNPLVLPENWELGDNYLWFNAGDSAGVYRYNGEEVGYFELPVQAGYSKFRTFGNTGLSTGKKGNLWIATYEAVFGYDGKAFEIINDTNSGMTKGNEYFHIRSILEDSKGNLWIGNNGLGVLLKRGDSILNFSENQGLIHENSDRNGNHSHPGTLEHIFAISEDNKGNIWFGDRDTGAWKYDGTTMKNYVIDENLKSQMIWHIYEDAKGDLLFAMGNGGVYRFNGEGFDKVF
ncbi:MAG: ligand-binding sensor domain-containing protein [Crocinitomicaceae bacterium]